MGVSTHGGYSKHKPTYQTWQDMKQRCYNKSHQQYKNYGARGIVICAEWQDFAQFIADMGPRPYGFTIDRIDNNGPYCKANCRWATRREQRNNQRDTVIYEWNGQRKARAVWADEFGIHPTSLKYLIEKRGLDAAFSHYAARGKK